MSQGFRRPRIYPKRPPFRIGLSAYGRGVGFKTSEKTGVVHPGPGGGPGWDQPFSGSRSISPFRMAWIAACVRS